MKALGMISGIGSMLIGAKEQGYEIVGNIEWRKYYWTGTFERNFPGAFMVHTVKDLTPEQAEACKGVDLLIGHTECGNFSVLNTQFRRVGHFSDIPQFVEAIQMFGPKTFAMDNLAPSLREFTPKWWHNMLPEYDIFFQWVGNWNYGNPQANRRRLFVIGARKELGFYFVPGERPGHRTDKLGKRIADIPEDVPNNGTLKDDDWAEPFCRYMFDRDLSPEEGKEHMTFAEFREAVKDIPAGQTFTIYNKSGKAMPKIGYRKVPLNKYAPLLHARPASFREDNCQPFTIRERARIQGCPDWFVFVPEDARPGTPEYTKLIVQTGKFMPVEFCTYLTGYIKWFLEGNVPEHYPASTHQRCLHPNDEVNNAQWEWCGDYDYTNQEKACEWCGSQEGCSFREYKCEQNSQDIEK